MVQQLLGAAAAAEEGEGAAGLAKTKNKAGQTALHMAAVAGSAPCAALLAEAAPDTVASKTKLGLLPADMAARRKHAALEGALRSPQPAAALQAAAQQQGEQQQGRTVLFAPPECLFHFTCPAPITR